jgi:hypothetical protein
MTPALWSLASVTSELHVFEEFVTRFWDQLVGRLSGPLSLRFVIQPAVAVTLGIRAGVRDARANRPPYLWMAITDGRHRRPILLSGWRDVSRLFAVATGLDIVYQIGVLRFFHPLQALTISCTLAIVPYVATRGLSARAVAYRRRPRR